MCDAVRHVLEFLGRVVVEIAEDALFDDIAVQLRYAVDAVRPHDAEIRHAHRVVREHGHPGDLIPISRILLPEVFAEAAVDLL